MKACGHKGEEGVCFILTVVMSSMRQVGHDLITTTSTEGTFLRDFSKKCYLGTSCMVMFQSVQITGVLLVPNGLTF